MSCVSCWNSLSASTSPPKAITNVAPPQRWMYGVAARNHFTKASVLSCGALAIKCRNRESGIGNQGVRAKVAPQRMDGGQCHNRGGLGAQDAGSERNAGCPAGLEQL